MFDAMSFHRFVLTARTHIGVMIPFRIYEQEYAMANNLAGVQWYEQQKYSYALTAFENAAQYDVGNALYIKNRRIAQATIYNDEGVALFKQGYLEAAQEKFSKALQEYREFPVALGNLDITAGTLLNKDGLVDMAAGRYENAIRNFRAAAHIDQAHSESYNRNISVCVAAVANNHGIAEWKRGDFQKALESFEIAASYDPSYKGYRRNAELARSKIR
jgi:tetratricopeptide (TPR) repeat protein